MNFKKILILATALMMVLSALSVTAFAEERTIANLSSAGDLRVFFEFDRTKPSITFISPSGQRIAEGNARLQFSDGDGWCTYLIENAEEGEWKIEYDKKSNNEVSYQIIDSIENILIENFTVGKPDGTNVAATFTASHSEGGRYYYRITLLNGERAVFGEEVLTLASGNASCGEVVERDIDLSRVADGKDYKLALYVEKDSVLFDSVSSDAFSYTNPNSPDAITDFDIHFNKRLSKVRLDWSGAENKSGRYSVLVTNKAGEEIYYNETDAETDEFLFVGDDEQLNITVYRFEGWLRSKPLSKKISTNPDNGIEIATGQISKSALGRIECKSDGKATVSLAMGTDEETVKRADAQTAGVITKKLDIEGDRTIDFNIIDINTFVFASMLAEDGIYYEDELDIYYDNTPPYIELYEKFDEINVETAHVTLVGETNSGAKLFINEAEQTVAEDGTFSCKVELSYGENKITLVAEDGAGNKTERVVFVTRVANEFSDFSTRGFISLFISLGVSIIIIVAVIISVRKKRRGQR